MYKIALLAALLALHGCTNVNQMHKLYQQGQDDQLFKIMEIVSRQDYPDKPWTFPDRLWQGLEIGSGFFLDQIS